MMESISYRYDASLLFSDMYGATSKKCGGSDYTPVFMSPCSAKIFAQRV
jgi:hypothetical protein